MVCCLCFIGQEGAEEVPNLEDFFLHGRGPPAYSKSVQQARRDITYTLAPWIAENVVEPEALADDRQLYLELFRFSGAGVGQRRRQGCERPQLPQKVEQERIVFGGKLNRYR